MSVESVKKSVLVEAPQEKAFRVFTERLDAWWPRTHKIGAAPMAKAVLEPREGGRWFEIGDDGSECDWGRVLSWEPHARLVLDWQITGAWKFDPSLHTTVEVRFIPEGTQTRVELEHRDLERFGAAEIIVALSGTGGWSGLLAAFGAEATR